MVRLGINIDHIATVRQARKEGTPDPVEAALIAERSGADSITAHLREDRRHIQDEDMRRLKNSLSTKLNMEMAPTPEMVSIACQIRPEDVCLVPEKRQELTTEGGLDILSRFNQIKKGVHQLKKRGIRVSLFIDPNIRQIRAASSIGADCVELHTGTYARAKNRLQRDREFRKLVVASKLTLRLGLLLNAGHGLDYRNVARVAKIKGMNELNIGFSVVRRSLFIGLSEAVKEMKLLINPRERC